MTLFSISELLVGITSLIVVFVLFKGKAKVHKLWILFNICVAIWGFGGFWASICRLPDEALIAWRIAHMGVIFIPITFYHFIMVFTHQEKSRLLGTFYFLGLFYLYL